MAPALLEKHLLYVTGKGGVGRTTVAASLGLAAARAGKRTIVCEVAEQDRVSRLFYAQGVRPETEVRLAENLWAITVDPQKALEEWVGRQVGGGAAVKLLARTSAFQYFVAAAPGAKELITIAKVWEIAQPERWDARNGTYDLIIVDAPASGHGLAMLTTPRTFAEIARVGPIRRQASRVEELLGDPERTGYLAVALPEEMPVAETLELEGRLRDAVGLGLDAIVVNGLFPERFSRSELATLEALATLAPPAASADGNGHGHGGNGQNSVRAARAEGERARAQRAHVRRLRRDAEARVLTLPFLFEPELGLEAYERLGRELARKL